MMMTLLMGVAPDLHAQSRKKSDLITVTLKVKTSDGIIYGNAKVWDATTMPVVYTHNRTDKKTGEVTLKVHPQSVLIVGEYMVWDEKTNTYIPISDADFFGEEGKKFYTTVKVEGRTSINVTVEQTMLDNADVTAESTTVKVKGEMRGNTMELSAQMFVPVQEVRTNNRFIWQPVIINQLTQEVQYGKAYVLDGREYSITQMGNYDGNIQGGDPLYEKGLVHICHDSLKVCKVKKYRKPKARKSKIKYAQKHGHFKVQNSDTVYFKIHKGDTLAYENLTDSVETYYYAITTHDKIYVDHPLTPFAYAIETLSEDYNRILISDSVDVHIYGVLHPLRLLDVKYHYAEVDSARYTNWWPQPKKGQRETEGSVDFKFLKSKSRLDSSDPHNVSELARAQQTVQRIIGAPGTVVTGLQVRGKASPEGSYQGNLKLATGRLSTALGYLKSFIPSDKRIPVLHEDLVPAVATWQEVADSMRKDGLTAAAEDIEKIVRANTSGVIEVDMNRQGRQIARLSCYDVIKELYLPKFRRVDFVLSTYVTRAANIHEIREMYARGEELDEYNYHQLYANEPDTLLRYKYCQEAFEKYPASIIFRTDHAGHLIAQNRPDTALLSCYTHRERFKIEDVGSFKVPEETRINQVIAYIQKQNFERAIKIAETYLSGSGKSKFAKCLARAYGGQLYGANGQVNDTIISAISESSPLNEIIIRLAVTGKAESEQRQRAEALCDSLLEIDKNAPLVNYLKAVCLKRLGVKEANNRSTIHLYRALEADPTLMEITKTDKDLYDRLYDEEMPEPKLRPKEDWEQFLENYK